MSCIYGTEQSCNECRMCYKEEQNTEIQEIHNDTFNKKAILVIDMPESCLKCPLLYGGDECILQDTDTNFSDITWDELREGCPLKELPKKMEVCGKYPQEDGINPSYKIGWNACIDEIVKAGENNEESQRTCSNERKAT